MKRRILRILLPLCIVLCFVSTAAFAGGSTAPADITGSGTADDPYLIYTAAGLNAFRDKVNGQYGLTKQPGAHAKLMADIVLNDGAFDEDGNWSKSGTPQAWEPIGYYKNDSDRSRYAGTFDGQGHTIHGLYVTGDREFAGLFGFAQGATIKNVTVDGYVSASGNRDTWYPCTGGIVGSAQNSTRIENCTNLSTVKSDFTSDAGSNYVGGITGMSDGTIIGCRNSGKVILVIHKKSNLTGYDFEAGGIAGYATAQISRCYNTKDITVLAAGTDTFPVEKLSVGGVVGVESLSTVSNCYNTGAVTVAGNFISSDRSNAKYICFGGVVGFSAPLFTVSNCYNTGKVTYTGSYDKINLGGVAGTNFSGTVADCYYLTGTAEKGVGSIIEEGAVSNTAVKTKAAFADGTVLALLKQNDTTGAWGDNSYFADAKMTIPLLRTQTGDIHTCAYTQRHNDTIHWKECECGAIEPDSASAHFGGTATCMEQAACITCGTKYGDRDISNHAGTESWIMVTATTHKNYWSCCGASTVTNAHAWENGACTVCGYECVHTGGTATCTEQAICKICQKKYGDAGGHSYGAPTYTWDGINCTAERICTKDTTHKETETVAAQVTVTQKRTCTYVELSTYTATFENTAFSIQIIENVRTADPLGHHFAIWQHNATYHWNKCTRCSAINSPTRHTGGTATCTEQAICKICKSAYGALDLTNHTGTADWTKNETSHEQKWSCCKMVVCKMGPHQWWRGVCLDCDTSCSHTGGTATCRTQAICDICHSAYGDLSATNHTGGTEIRNTKLQDCLTNGYTGDTYCKSCHEKLASGTVIPADGHKGGTATCNEKAVCTVCHEKYGELDANHHSRLSKVEEIPATAANTGTSTHWHCTTCGKRFADAKGTNEISLADTILKKRAPSILEGANNTWIKGTENSLSFRSDAAFSDFMEVLVDGNAIPAGSYTKGEGSIRVELKAHFLATLAEGAHTLIIRSTSGDAIANFTVEAEIVPQPTNSIPAWVWILLAVLVLGIGVTIVGIRIRKKRAA